LLSNTFSTVVVKLPEVVTGEIILLLTSGFNKTILTFHMILVFNMKHVVQIAVKVCVLTATGNVHK